VTEDSPLWWISIPVATSEDPKRVTRHDFKTREATVRLPVGGAKWFKANSGQSGFFRVRYPGDLSAKLTTALENLSLPPVDRIGLQSDAFALAVAGIIPTTEALALARSYTNEVDYTVWLDLSSNLGHFSSVWSGEPNYQHVKDFVRRIFTPIFTKLGWDPIQGESDLVTLLRPIVLSRMGVNGDVGVVAEAKKRFASQVSGERTIAADLRDIVYRLVVQYGDEKDFDAVQKIYRTADMQEEKIRALKAMGFSENVALVQRYLNFLLTEEVRSQDLYVGFWTLQASTTGRNEAWRFLRERWTDIHARIGNSGMLIDRTIGLATGSFVSEDRAKEIEEFFAAHPEPHAERTIKQSIETIHSNAKWLRTNRDAVSQFLANHK